MESQAVQSLYAYIKLHTIRTSINIFSIISSNNFLKDYTSIRAKCVLYIVKLERNSFEQAQVEVPKKLIVNLL
jgi:hypothetical protein